MATIRDVAQLAQVSVATVSAVLNRTSYVSPELTKRVNDAVRQLDYSMNRLAQSFQTGTTRTIGMLIPATANPNPYYGEVVRGAEDYLRKRGYVVILGHTYNQIREQSRYIQTFRSRMVDGLLLFPAPGEDAEMQKLLESKRPVVFVGRNPGKPVADVVAADVRRSTYLGISHLISRGHTNIGLIIVKRSLSVAEDRRRGWQEALTEHGLAADPSWVIEEDLSSKAGESAALRLLEHQPRPTAIFAANLVFITGILRVLAANGIQCPGEIEVMCSDDAEWLDVFQPRISTVVQPSYEVGVRAAELLLKRIQHPRRRFEMILLEPELRIRQ